MIEVTGAKRQRVYVTPTRLPGLEGAVHAHIRLISQSNNLEMVTFVHVVSTWVNTDLMENHPFLARYDVSHAGY